MAICSRIRQILLLVCCAAVYVDALDVGGHDFLETTIAYRKKSNTVAKRKCLRSQDLVCDQQDQYCAAFHVGKHFFATAAHCLVGVDGYIQDPNELEIVGIGKVNVTIALHHNFDNMTGIDVAWIHYKHPEQVTTVNVAKEKPIVCKIYYLDVFDPVANGIHAGHRWIEGNAFEQPLKVKHPMTGRSYEIQNHSPDHFFVGKKDYSNVDHVVLCTAKDSIQTFEVHYIEVGFVKNILITIDCHYAKCSYIDPENMMQPVTTTTTTTTTITTTSATLFPPPPTTITTTTITTTPKPPPLEPKPPQPQSTEVAQPAPTPKPVVSPPTKPPIPTTVRQATKPTRRSIWGTPPPRSYSSQTGGNPRWTAGNSRWKPKWTAGYSRWSAGNSRWTTGNQRWSAGNSKWSVGNPSWSAGNPEWSAGSRSWSAGNPEWSAGNPEWSAGNPPYTAGPLLHQGGIVGQSNVGARNSPWSVGSPVWDWSNTYEAGPLSQQGKTTGIDGQLKWDPENPSGSTGWPWSNSYEAGLLSHQGSTPGIDGQSNWNAGNSSWSAGSPAWDSRNSYEAGPLSHQGNTPGIDGHSKWNPGNPRELGGVPEKHWNNWYEADPLSHQGNTLGIDGKSNWDPESSSGSVESPDMDGNNWYSKEPPLLNDGNTMGLDGRSDWNAELGESPPVQNSSKYLEDNLNVSYFNEPLKIPFKTPLGRHNTNKSAAGYVDVDSSSSQFPDLAKSIQDVPKVLFHIPQDDEDGVDTGLTGNHSKLDEEGSKESTSEYDEYDMDEEIESDDEHFQEYPTSASDDSGFSSGSNQWSAEDYELLAVPFATIPKSNVATTRRKCRKPSPTSRKYMPSVTEEAKPETTPRITIQDVLPKPVKKITMRHAYSSAVAIGEGLALLQTFFSALLAFILTW